MKKLLFLVMSLCMLSNLSYASFPVVENDSSSEVVVFESNTDDESPWSKMTVKPQYESFHWGGLALGFLLGLIGVGIAYLFSKNPAVKRSSWYGLGLWAIVFLQAGSN